jgi:NADPH2:quinone reductase
MRALVCNAYGPPESLVLEQRRPRARRAGEVLVDLRGRASTSRRANLIAGEYQVKTPPPFVPGGEAAGVIAAAGAGVERLRPGDRVIVTPSLGAFAEKCVLPERLCMPLPASLSFEQGAGFTVTHATTYHAFRQSTELRPGETVLVLGAAGGVGVAAVEIAKRSARGSSRRPAARRSWPGRPVPTKRLTTPRHRCATP